MREVAAATGFTQVTLRAYEKLFFDVAGPNGDYPAVRTNIILPLQVRDVVALQMDETRHPRALRVLLRDFDHQRRGIAAEETIAQRTQAFLRAPLGFVVQALPQRGVVPAPGEEPEMPPAQSRGDVRSHQRRFDQQGAGAAHRIQQRTAARVNLRPARAQQHRGGEVFLQRSLALVTPPAAPVPAPARTVQAPASVARVVPAPVSSTAATPAAAASVAGAAAIKVMQLRRAEAKARSEDRRGRIFVWATEEETDAALDKKLTAIERRLAKAKAEPET